MTMSMLTDRASRKDHLWELGCHGFLGYRQAAQLRDVVVLVVEGAVVEGDGTGITRLAHLTTCAHTRRHSWDLPQVNRAGQVYLTFQKFKLETT